MNRESKKRQILIFAVVAAVAAILAVAVGISIYNAPKNRLKRCLDLGNKYLLEQDYEQAIVAFNKVIEIEPMNVDAYLGLAKAYVGKGNQAEAIAVLEKGYELTKSEEILKKLEELRGNISTAVEATEKLQGENGLPYYELGFSPEDFKIAGYSVMDGNHLKDIRQAAMKVMFVYEGGGAINANETVIYDGWGLSGDGEVTNTAEYGMYGGVLFGSPEGRNAMGCQLLNGELLIWLDNHDGEVIARDFPLYEGSIIPNVTSYEEVLDILGVRQIIQEECHAFESQYGYTKCFYSKSKDGYVVLDIGSGERAEWSIKIHFRDNIVSSFSIGCNE